MTENGVLTVISGFSGAGKGTMVRGLLRNYYGQYELSVSATTRRPRFGEQEGVHYFFKSKEEFEKMIEEDAFVEYAEYLNQYYGTPKAFIEEELKKGKNVILEIDVQGALQVKKKFPDAILVFVTAPSYEELERRLRGRGTETDEEINNRLLQAKDEVKFMDQYDYIFVSDIMEEAPVLLNGLIKAEHCRKNRRLGLINDLKEQFENEGRD